MVRSIQSRAQCRALRMPFKATSRRRQIIMVTLLACAVVGGFVRWQAPNPSLARDVGNLLLVLWVPAIGNVIAFLVNQLRRGRVARGAFGSRQFQPQLRVEMTPFESQLRPVLGQLDPRDDNCAVVLGTDGFTARTSEPLTAWLPRGPDQPLALEFLKPALALPRFAAGTVFRMLAGNTLVAEGKVIAAASPSPR
jgi:hypothetical protein